MTKRGLCMLLALAAVFSLTVPAFAGEALDGVAEAPGATDVPAGEDTNEVTAEPEATAFGHIEAAAPELGAFTRLANGVTVTWDSVPGAVKYRLYYKANRSGTWTALADTTENSYTWEKAESGTQYYFRVRCVSGDGKNITSGYSAAKSIKFIVAPKDVKASCEPTGIQVTWTPSPGAAKYRVYCKPEGGSWAKAGDVSGTETSYTWTKAKSGVKYRIQVRCVTSDGKTATSTYDTVRSIKYLAPPNVTGLVRTVNGVKVSWDPVPGAAKYRVYYKAGSDGTWTALADTTKTSYAWENAKSGTQYSFRVRCVTSDGKHIASYYGASRSIRFVAAPKDVKAGSVPTGIQVTWTPSPGAARYRVFYKPEGESWAKADDVSGTETSYIWMGARSGVKYQMRVLCVTSDGMSITSTFDTVATITYGE